MKKTDTTLNRRTFLQGTAIGAGLLAAPALISSKALASSGELNYMGWAGYPALTEKVFPAFTAKTGITVNFNEQPDQDAMFAQAKLALQTGGTDMVEPTVDRVGGWASNGLIQPWDMTKLNVDNYLPGLADGKMGEMATVDGQRMIVLSVWGTEALVYNKETMPLEYGKASLGDLFNPANTGKVVARPHSSLAAMGRWLDSRRQTAEAVAGRLQGRSDDGRALGHRACRSHQGEGQHRPVVVGRERGPGGLQGKRRRDRPVLGLDRLQPACRRLRLHPAEGRRLRLEPGLSF